MRKTTRNSGFTLIEMVIMLFLAAIILLSVSRLTGETVSTLSFLREKAQTYQSALVGIERLSSDLREAVVAPTITPGASFEMSFRKVKPGEDRAKDAPPRPSRSDPGYLAYAAPTGAYAGTNLIQVTYKKDGETLNRQFGSFSSRIAENINDIQVVDEGGGSFAITLTVKENRRLQIFEGFVTCPGLAP